MDEFMTIKEQIIEKIKEYNSIVIFRHLRPDGDAIGSSLGLKALLCESFPEKQIYTSSEDCSKYLEFLGPDDTVSDELIKESLVIVVDTGDAKRISDQRFLTGKEIIKIDHHLTKEDYGTINYVRPNQASCCDIIIDLAMSFPDVLKMNDSAASFLFTGMVTDSGRFKYESSGKECHFHASYVLNWNVDMDKIFANLYVEEKDAFKLKKYVYNNYKITKDGVAYIYFRRGSDRRLKTSSENLSACVNMLDSIKGSMIWLLFNENNENIRVRLRSRYIPLTALAEKYHGGGHTNACGATVYSRKEMKALINDANDLLKAFKAEHEDLF